MKRVSIAILLGTIGVSGTELSAQNLTPITITMVGPGAILVEVAAGTVRPCDSSSNQQLYRARMLPADTVTFQSPTRCVCWRQTYDNFPDANWSASQISCKPGVTCIGRRCVPDRDPVLRLSILSTDPNGTR